MPHASPLPQAGAAGEGGVSHRGGRSRPGPHPKPLPPVGRRGLTGRRVAPRFSPPAGGRGWGGHGVSLRRSLVAWPPPQTPPPCREEGLERTSRCLALLPSRKREGLGEGGVSHRGGRSWPGPHPKPHPPAGRRGLTGRRGAPRSSPPAGGRGWGREGGLIETILLSQTHFKRGQGRLSDLSDHALTSVRHERG